MPVTSQHVTGFVVGLGGAAALFYFYKMNQKAGRCLAGEPGNPSSWRQCERLQFDDP